MMYQHLSIILTLTYVFGYSHSLYLEELEKLNYKVDIQQTPIKRGEEPLVPIIHIASKNGQEYTCILPEKEEKNIPDMKELLKPLESEPCLTQKKDWYTYKICFGRYIEQHLFRAAGNYTDVFVLGTYDSDYEWSNDTDQDVSRRHHSQYYTNGTTCGPVGPPRVAEIRLYCEEDSEDYIAYVKEPAVCQYLIIVRTSHLCSHPKLKPRPPQEPVAKKKANSISCHPLLNEEQYSSYLKNLMKGVACINFNNVFIIFANFLCIFACVIW